MKIIKDEAFTKYVCSICGHKHIIMSDGTTKYEPFRACDRKIKTYEPWEENTTLGVMEVPHLVEYDAYVCPICNTVQMDSDKARRIHKPELIRELKEASERK